MTAHRRLSIPFSRAPMGECRWCGKPILKEDGEPNRRRNWHPECVHAYKLSWPDYARIHVWKRDHGRCAACGKVREGVKRGRLVYPWRNPQNPDQVEVGPYCDFGIGPVWDLDHRAPLKDGGAHTLDNMQTLCQPCHKAKTAREAGERARRKRPQQDLLEAMA